MHDTCSNDDDDVQQIRLLLHGSQQAARARPFASSLVPPSENSPIGASSAPSLLSQSLGAPQFHPEPFRGLVLPLGQRSYGGIMSCPSPIQQGDGSSCSFDYPLTAPLYEWQRKEHLKRLDAIATSVPVDEGSDCGGATQHLTKTGEETVKKPLCGSSLGKGSKKLSSADWLITSHLSITREPRFLKEHMWYLVYQREICPTKKKEHWQGYVQFRKVVTLKAAQALTCCPDQHFEPTYGSPDQCVRYCTKSFSRYPGTEPFIIGFLQPRIVGVNPTNIMYTTYKNRGYTDQALMDHTELSNVLAFKNVTTEIDAHEGERLCEELIVFNEYNAKYTAADFKLMIDGDRFIANSKGKSVVANARVVFICSNLDLIYLFLVIVKKNAPFIKIRVRKTAFVRYLIITSGL